MARQRRGRIAVERGAHLGRQTVERDVFGMEHAAAIIEMMHGLCGDRNRRGNAHSTGAALAAAIAAILNSPLGEFRLEPPRCLAAVSISLNDDTCSPPPSASGSSAPRSCRWRPRPRLPDHRQQEIRRSHPQLRARHAGLVGLRPGQDDAGRRPEDPRALHHREGRLPRDLLRDGRPVRHPCGPAGAFRRERDHRWTRFRSSR